MINTTKHTREHRRHAHIPDGTLFQFTMAPSKGDETHLQYQSHFMRIIYFDIYFDPCHYRKFTKLLTLLMNAQF